MPTTKTPPRGLLLIGLRLPIWLYRLHLGWLLGGRFMLLTHRGRTSGLARRAVVEVIGHEDGAYFVASGWGTRSDWFRNIQATPSVTITVGRRTRGATAEVLPLDAAGERLHAYARQHPRAFRELTSIMTGDRVPATAEACRKMADSVPVVAFRYRA
jgi:deazaflavin-dependent oxidoreductase (nitroreductase family)